jgi:DNA mismatch repair protein MutS
MNTADQTRNETSDSAFSTPMMKQYLALKKMYSDCLLFFRLGDFYELFLEDAEIGSKIMGLTLTSRSRGRDGRIPMAGVPYHAVDSYIAKVIQAGYKIAICDQMTPPDGKGLVERQVTRVITPGTFLDEKHLPARESNFLAILCRQETSLGCAVVDVSTGNLFLDLVSLTPQKTTQHVVSDILTLFSPREWLIPCDSYGQADQSLSQYISSLSPQPPAIFPTPSWQSWVSHPKDTLLKLAPQIDSHTINSPLLLELVAGLLEYLNYTQHTTLKHLSSPQHIFSDTFLQLDRSTIQNLEIINALGTGQTQGSLLAVIDRTTTPMGARLLKQWVLRPLADKTAIEARLDAVAWLTSQPELRHLFQTELKAMTDWERLLGRVNLGLSTPRDLISLAYNLTAADQLAQLLKSLKKNQLPSLFKEFQTTLLPDFWQLRDFLKGALKEPAPFDPRQGGIFQDGFNPKLDKLRTTTTKHQTWLADFETAERARTSISSLKVRYNQVFGFYIEVSKANLHLVPENYQRHQTLVNAERFITEELKAAEQEILHAEEAAQKLEYELFLEVVDRVQLLTKPLQQAAQALAGLDCLVGLADLAENADYHRPTLTTDGTLNLKQSRHPVVEYYVKDRPFVPNDLSMSSETNQLLLITGPNMAGKSVLMRQVAVITLLAHVGSFVPATEAKLSLTDRIFVRSGANDRIGAGLSTFMVEMVETAYILRHATPHSLIIMDEIGRGTSTYDGISLAWSIAEKITQESKGPKTLFATHYHELQTLATHYPTKITNVHLAVDNQNKQPVFLYHLQPGGASHSFGLAVAQLAELPKEVIARAQQLLSLLENSNQKLVLPIQKVATQSQNRKDKNSKADKNSPYSLTSNFSLLTSSSLNTDLLSTEYSLLNTDLLSELASLQLDQLTPLEALNQLAHWQKRLKSATTKS